MASTILAWLSRTFRIGAATPYSLTWPASDSSGVLTSDGAGALSWGGNDEIQRKVVTVATALTTTSTAFAAVTGMSDIEIVIPAERAAAEILILGQFFLEVAREQDQAQVEVEIRRDTTRIAMGQMGTEADAAGVNPIVCDGCINFAFWDTPGEGTFSYNVRWRVQNGTNNESGEINETSPTTTGPSCLTIIEYPDGSIA